MKSWFQPLRIASMILLALFSCLLVFSHTVLDQTNTQAWFGNHYLVTYTDTPNIQIQEGSLLVIHSNHQEPFNEGDVVAYLATQPEVFNEVLFGKVILEVSIEGQQGWQIESFYNNQIHHDNVLFNRILGPLNLHLPNVGRWLNEIKNQTLYAVLIVFYFAILMVVELWMIHKRVKGKPTGS
jgi:hypothetical protein